MLQLVTSGLHAYAGSTSGPSVAAFDLDWTLVRSIRGKFFKDEDDWSFLPNRIGVLRYYRDAGHAIAIFTNQGYKGAKLVTAINRVNKIITALLGEGINPWVFAATGESAYRKPGIGMWQVFSQYKPDIDKTTSLYVGDAAGRPQDHSADDRGFAAAVGITFYTPEEIFPSICILTAGMPCTVHNQVDIPDTQTMFIFVGMPGSGKTTFYHQKLEPKGWIHANQDILKTQSKMLSTVRNALASGQSVAVDATNPGIDKRMEYLSLAAQYQVPTMIIYFVRNGDGWNKLRPNPVPTIAYSMYYKNLIEPSPEIDSVPVVQIA